jgi:flagellar basal body-associated protein FliL
VDSANPSGDKKSLWDLWLQRLAWVAQITLAVVAVVTFNLYVLPISQKNLLDEQIATRTIELKDATTERDQLRAEASRLRDDNARLSKDSEATYKQLRANLALDLSSSAAQCGFLTFKASFDAQQEVSCVIKYVQDRIVPKLRPDDKARLSTLLENHKQELLAAIEVAAKQYLSKTRRINKSVKDLETELTKVEKDLYADIQQHRRARGDAQASVRKQADVGAVDEYEREAIVQYLLKSKDLLASHTLATMEQIGQLTGFGSAQSAAIRGVMEKVRKEFE